MFAKAFRSQNNSNKARYGMAKSSLYSTAALFFFVSSSTCFSLEEADLDVLLLSPVLSPLLCSLSLLDLLLDLASLLLPMLLPTPLLPLTLLPSPAATNSWPAFRSDNTTNSAIRRNNSIISNSSLGSTARKLALVFARMSAAAAEGERSMVYLLMVDGVLVLVLVLVLGSVSSLVGAAVFGMSSLHSSVVGLLVFSALAFASPAELSAAAAAAAALSFSFPGEGAIFLPRTTTTAAAAVTLLLLPPPVVLLLAPPLLSSRSLLPLPAILPVKKSKRSNAFLNSSKDAAAALVSLPPSCC
mmetsp:Transcript_32510/g.60080  ORF Transcript_32510/g.60080 Transcript_32510/m.60080 type:complete len:300 (+) Transcript_32510:75-974(+)